MTGIMFSKRTGLFAASVMLICCVMVEAATTGSIRGQVKDADGEPLHGATVTIHSDALISNALETFTNQSGVFRFPSIPIGYYLVQVTLVGFETVRIDRVEVRLDSTANVPVSMKVLQLTQSLTIIGESPALDVTRAGIASSYKNEMLTEIPTHRQFYDLIHLAPGISPALENTVPYASAVAFGSNIQSSSWLMDGVNISMPETGWTWFNPIATDDIEEIQVIGPGASAEYGNHTGAVFNIVTKRGGNVFHGASDYYLQTDSLTGENIHLSYSPYAFHRDYFRNFSGQLGGPIRKDKIWFFGSGEYFHDSYTEPGNNPDFPQAIGLDKYHFKISAAAGRNHQLNLFTSGQWIAATYANEFTAPSAQPTTPGSDPSWGAGWTSTLTPNVLMELNYAGWRGHLLWTSRTGSLEDPMIDAAPPDGGPPRSSGGVLAPWEYLSWRHQANAKLTYYADNFLKKHHEFKFGVQFSDGLAKSSWGIGANGSFTYSPFLMYVQDPFQYGGTSTYLAGFIDDSVSLSDRLNLNLGIRYDHLRGAIQDFEKLIVGTPSITSVGNFKATGQVIPGIEDLIRWDMISPRLGFTFQPRADGRSVVSASFGVYYDQNIIGNWEFPPPQTPPLKVFARNPDTGLYDVPLPSKTYSDVSQNYDLKPPRTLQYSVGYQQEVWDDSSFGVQYVFKDTKDLIGWEILGGEWDPYDFVDPFTGREYTLLNQVSPPVLRKGNDPGDFPGSEDLRYFQKYHGLILTYNKRFSENFGFNASYTWSRSTGLLPRMLNSFQGIPAYTSREGSDPNNLINAEGRLQGDRPHMFRLQTVFRKLPWELQASASIDFSSGRPYSRQIFVGLNQGLVTVIMEPTGAYHLSTVQNIDVSIGKQFPIRGDLRLRFEAWILNLLNSDNEILLSGLTLQSPEQDFVPISWAAPRRLQVRVGFQF